MGGNMLPDINLGTKVVVVENLRVREAFVRVRSTAVDKGHCDGHKRDQHPSNS
jgi:hypothetical protein